MGKITSAYLPASHMSCHQPSTAGPQCATLCATCVGLDLLQVIPFSAFSFPKFIMLRRKCTSQVGLSIELQQASRICPESKKASTKNAPLTPPNGVEMCSIVFFEKHFSLKFGHFSFHKSVPEKEYSPFLFFFFPFVRNMASHVE